MLGDGLEQDMQKLVDTYKCEWNEVVDSPELREKFSHFVNDSESDPDIEFVPMREQKMPAP